MKKFMLLISILLVSILITQNGQAQYLVKLNSDYQTDLLNNSGNWTYELNGIQFATVPDLSVLDNQGLEYNILANDIETGKYYWVESRFATLLNISEINIDQNTEVVWYNSKTALVNVKNTKLFSEQLPREYALRRIIFNRPAIKQQSNYTSNKNYSKKGVTSIVQTIIDSVSIDELYLTEEHLSGESPFWLNGQLDSLQTRYSYSPQIHIAKEYLEDRFETYGYTVEYLHFGSGTFYDIQFMPGSPNYGWIITVDKIFGTDDGGQTWSVQFEGTSGGDLWSVFPFNQTTAYSVGDNGLILKTSDGSTWQQLSSSTSAFLFGVQFKSDTLGWVCGDNGLISKTIDGGTTWSTKTTPTSDRLYDIFFINENTGWAVGKNGTIIHTNDSGESWTSQSSSTSSRLYGVHFKNANEGYVVGWDSVVLKTINGGSSWATISVPANSRFYDIDFIDQNTGMIAGWDGTCLITTDGGNSWNTGGNIFQQNIYGLDLVNSTEVWVSGSNLVAQSIDFGSNWVMKLDNIPSASLINLIATKTGTQYPDQHFIVCAHYDATVRSPNNPMVSAPGADDNGSGTAVVIEAARVLADYNFNYSIKFILFPGEEQGLLGSNFYAANASATGEQILGVLNMDMIGYDGNNDNLMEIHAGNLAGSQSIGSYMVSNISSFGLSLTAEYKTSSSSTASDHSSFWSYGFPAIMHIEDFQDFTPHYHTPNDLLSSLNLPYYLENAKLTIGTLALLAEIDSISANLPNHELIPAGFSLSDPYPNPFNPSVNIKYSLNTPGHVKIEIFDVLGKKIKSLVNGYHKGNEYHITWNGRNENNKNAASGIYLIKYEYGNSFYVKKTILLR